MIMQTWKRSFCGRSVLVFSILALLAPSLALGTTLVGHPYAMYYNREVGSPNFDTGIVYMWFGMGYVGAARIPSMATGGFYAQGCWESLRDAMMNKKFTIVWTDAGPHSNTNDLSEGNLVIFVVTIFAA
jgi:hypothetical protein